jgi:hypothetical protein
MSNRWRPEAKLAERLYKDARPYLVSLSSPRVQARSTTPDGFVREALAAGEWAIAVTDMLHFGWQPDDATREEIWRIWVNGPNDRASISEDRALRFSA